MGGAWGGIHQRAADAGFEVAALWQPALILRLHRVEPRVNGRLCLVIGAVDTAQPAHNVPDLVAGLEALAGGDRRRRQHPARPDALGARQELARHVERAAAARVLVRPGRCELRARRQRAGQRAVAVDEAAAARVQCDGALPPGAAAPQAVAADQPVAVGVAAAARALIRPLWDVRLVRCPLNLVSVGGPASSSVGATELLLHGGQPEGQRQQQGSRAAARHAPKGARRS